MNKITVELTEEQWTTVRACLFNEAVNVSLQAEVQSHDLAVEDTDEYQLAMEIDQQVIWFLR